MYDSGAIADGGFQRVLWSLATRYRSLVFEICSKNGPSVKCGTALTGAHDELFEGGGWLLQVRYFRDLVILNTNQFVR